GVSDFSLVDLDSLLGAALSAELPEESLEVLLDNLMVTKADAEAIVPLTATPVGTTLLADNFDDPQVGLLPHSSGAARDYRRRYVDGEYQLQTLDREVRWAAARTPGRYDDTSLTADARLVGEGSERSVLVSCRGQADGLSRRSSSRLSGGYYLVVD